MPARPKSSFERWGRGTRDSTTAGPVCASHLLRTSLRPCRNEVPRRRRPAAGTRDAPLAVQPRRRPPHRGRAEFGHDVVDHRDLRRDDTGAECTCSVGRSGLCDVGVCLSVATAHDEFIEVSESSVVHASPNLSCHARRRPWNWLDAEKHYAAFADAITRSSTATRSLTCAGEKSPSGPMGLKSVKGDS